MDVIHLDYVEARVLDDKIDREERLAELVREETVRDAHLRRRLDLMVSGAYWVRRLAYVGIVAYLAWSILA